MTNQDIEKLQKKFNKLKEVEKWEFVLKYKKEIRLLLDNDSTTFFFLQQENDNEIYYFNFDQYIGWSEGVFDLLEVLGIDAEGV